MKNCSQNGKFIVFEGLDGSGKTSQISRIVQHMQGNCITTKEPSDGLIGQLARNSVRGIASFAPEAMALLFAADRLDHIAKIIRPALEAGTHVLCDRYVYSNLAYQGMDIPLQTIAAYNSAAFDFVVPDLTIFLDTSPQECTQRILASRTETELYDGLEYAAKIREQYFHAFECFKHKMPVTHINGDAQKSAVTSMILEAVAKLT